MALRRSAAKRREEIFRREGYRCVYCGDIFPVEELSLDHVEPRVKGGDASEGNLVTSCIACNRAKGGRAAWAFLARERGKRDNFLRLATAIWPRLRRAVEEAARD